MMMPYRQLLLSSFLLLFLTTTAIGSTSPPSDSSKYRGYRLELTNFSLLKEKSDWLKINCTIVNSGRMNVDLGREGTDHWVIFRFDKSIYEAKLGGYRENIKQQLIAEAFELEAGKMVRNKELKISAVISTPVQDEPAKTVETKTPEDPNTSPQDKLAWEFNEPRHYPNPEDKLTEKGPIPDEMIAEPATAPEEERCPDIFISDLKVIEQNDRWATVQYTVTNQGQGTFYLFGKADGKKDNLYVNAYLSGVTTLTRGALPIGGQVMTEEVRAMNELRKGESVTAQIKLDVRKKTRYMKSLILSLESHQFAEECNRTNNSLGVVLK